MTIQDQELEQRIQQMVDRAVASVRQELEEKLLPLQAAIDPAVEMSPATAAPDVASAAPHVDDLGQLHQALTRLGRAETQSQVLEAMLQETDSFADRCAFFVSDENGVHGWGANGFDRASVKDAHFDYETHPVWQRLSNSAAAIDLDSADCAQIANSLLGSPASDGVLIPFFLRGAVAGALYADRLDPESRLEARGLQILTRVAALTLETQPLHTDSVAPPATLLEPTPDQPIPAPTAPDPTAHIENETTDDNDLSGSAAALAAAAGVTAAAGAVAGFELGRSDSSDDLGTAPLDEPVFTPEQPFPSAIELPDAIEEEPAIELEDTAVELPGEPDPIVTTDSLSDPGQLNDPGQSSEFEMSPFATEPEPPAVESPVENDPVATEPAEVELEDESVELNTAEAVDSSFAPATEPVTGFAISSGPEAAPPADEPWNTRSPEFLGSPAEASPDEITLESETAQADETTLDGPTELGTPVEPTSSSDSSENPDDKVFEVGMLGSMADEADDLFLDSEDDEEVDVAPDAPPLTEVSPIGGSVDGDAALGSSAIGGSAIGGSAFGGSAFGGSAAVEPEQPAQEATNEVKVVGTQIVPPADLSGPGTAFLSNLSVSDVVSDSSTEEAERLARLLISEIKLYNEEEVNRGRENHDIYTRLRDDIDRSRQIFDERIDSDSLGDRDLFHDELVRVLAGGDADALGM